MTRNAFTLLMFALLAVIMAFASVPSANAQTFSGRGVDMRAIQGKSHSCRDPAMNLQGRLIRLRVSIKQILECNEKGGFYRENGNCDLAVSPGHSFIKDPATSPSNEDTLAFITGGGTALIGGPDGETVTCAPLPSCTYDGTDYEDGDSITLYEQSEVCDEGCIPRVFTCVGDRFSPPIPSDIYDNPGSCPAGPCDGCVDPCTGASLDDDEQTGFVYKDPRACGENCTSTNLTCSNGTLSDPPSDWEGFVCGCPDETCGGCLSDTFTWTVADYTCEGDVLNANDGDTETANNTLDGLDGSADFTCDDGDWGPPTNASCEPGGPNSCSADTLFWTVGGNSCSGDVVQTDIGDSDTAMDNVGDATGSATFSCGNDGTWGDPTSAECVANIPDDCVHNGVNIPHGESATFYRSEMSLEDERFGCMANLISCYNIVTTCADGVLSPSPEGHNLTSCEPGFFNCRENCPTDDPDCGCQGLCDGSPQVSCGLPPTFPVGTTYRCCNGVWEIFGPGTPPCVEQ